MRVGEREAQSGRNVQLFDNQLWDDSMELRKCHLK